MLLRHCPPQPTPLNPPVYRSTPIGVVTVGAASGTATGTATAATGAATAATGAAIVDASVPSDAALVEPTPADTESARLQSIDAMTRATDLLRTSAQLTQAAQRERDDVQRERDALLVEQRNLQLEVQRQRELVAQQTQAHAQQLQKAETARHMQTLKCLQETLIACGQPAASVAMPAFNDAADINAQHRLIADTAVNMAAHAEQTIKGLTNSSHATEQRALEHMQREKRARVESEVTQERLTTLAKNLHHFGGDNAMHRSAGTVNASADQPTKVPRLVQSVTEAMQAFQHGNPTALWKDYRTHYTSLAGTVNASANYTERADDLPELNAQQLHPGLFDTMMHMNKGRIPAQQETQTMIDSMRRPVVRMPYRH